MRILIVCWRNGENNPFEYFSTCLANTFKTMGHEPRIIFLDSDFDSAFAVALKWKPDVAIAWQGIGSNLRVGQTNQLVWEHFKIPLFCWHGDHPSHMPTNHLNESKYVLHGYAAASFCEYASKHFSGNGNPPILLQSVSIMETHRPPIQGSYFVFLKNLDDPLAIEETWYARYEKNFAEYLISTSKLIYEHHLTGAHVTHHEVIDATLTEDVVQNAMTNMGCASLSDAFHALHSMLDMRYRNLLSMNLIELLDHVPIQIYGRGWERFKARGNSKHQYFDALDVSKSDFLYQSSYGVLDVMPIFDCLHDRTLRACRAGSGFVAVGSWNQLGYLPNKHASLFSQSVDTQLLENVEQVMRDPERHRTNTNAFRQEYDSLINKLTLNQVVQFFALSR